MGTYPTIIHQLDQWPQHHDFHKSSLKKIFIGGGSVSPSILQSVSRKFALKKLGQVYGMTEMTCCVSCSTIRDDLKSVGRPLPFAEMKVVDFYTREVLGPNQQGEVCIKSPAAFKAYLNKPKATADAYEDGFVRTGDKGCYTADGCFFICGRFKELIKCMDQQVYPAEFEELLAADPELRQVVVAGVPHPQYGEAVPGIRRSFEDELLGSKVSVVIENGVVKSRVKSAVIPNVTFESFFTDVWQRHKDLIALVDTLTDTTYTFGELLDASRRVAGGLRRLGLCTEDVVAFHGPNCCELLVAMCGTFFAGGTGMLCKGSLTRVYGMTELTSCIACSTQQDDLKSVGKPAPFVEMKVVDFCTRKTLGPNQHGEVCVKSPGAFKAYLNQPKATADAYEDGFIRTGDSGYYTADGCFFLCGRLKELVKCMDQQVYPGELEELLAADPEVRQVVVAGVPHPQYGEAARAYVVHQRRLKNTREQEQETKRLKKLVAAISSRSDASPSSSRCRPLPPSPYAIRDRHGVVPCRSLMLPCCLVLCRLCKGQITKQDGCPLDGRKFADDYGQRGSLKADLEQHHVLCITGGQKCGFSGKIRV
ncbi:hypothetical protein MTO96_028935 [Rhipicephalus appendiculatus]